MTPKHLRASHPGFPLFRASSPLHIGLRQYLFLSESHVKAYDARDAAWHLLPAQRLSEMVVWVLPGLWQLQEAENDATAFGLFQFRHSTLGTPCLVHRFAVVLLACEGFSGSQLQEGAFQCTIMHQKESSRGLPTVPVRAKLPWCLIPIIPKGRYVLRNLNFAWSLTLRP